MYKIPKLNWGKCPYCLKELNTWNYIPSSTLFTSNFIEAICPSCKKDIDVKVEVIINHLIEKVYD